MIGQECPNYGFLSAQRMGPLSGDGGYGKGREFHCLATVATGGTTVATGEDVRATAGGCRSAIAESSVLEIASDREVRRRSVAW